MAYSDEEKTKIINTICERVASGEAVSNITGEDAICDLTTFYNWIDEDEDKSNQYTRAIKRRADSRFDTIRDLAAEECTYTIETEEGIITRTDGAKVQHQRLKIDTEKWMLGKENSPKYGDKVVNENINKNFDVNLTEEQNAKLIKELEAEAAKKNNVDK